MFLYGTPPETRHPAFQRWLQRPLNQRQRRIIATLEMLRRTPGEEPRLYIHDDGSTPADDIPRLLADYLRWIQHITRRTPQPPALVIARSATAAGRLTGFSRTCYHGSLRAVTNWRGTNFSHLLVVDADRTPLPDLSDEAFYYRPHRTVHQFLQIPAVTQCCNHRSIVIIHGNVRRWSTQFSLRFFDTASDASTRYLALAVQPLPAYLMRRNRIKSFRLGCNPWRDSIIAAKTKVADTLACKLRSTCAPMAKKYITITFPSQKQIICFSRYPETASVEPPAVGYGARLLPAPRARPSPLLNYYLLLRGSEKP